MAPQVSQALTTAPTVSSSVQSTFIIATATTALPSSTLPAGNVAPVNPTLPAGSSTLPSSISSTSESLLATPAQSATTKPESKGVSGGTVAGVAIACLIAGAAIAALVFFFVYRKKKNKRPGPHAQPSAPYQNRALGPEKGAIAMTTTVPSNIDHLLPQPVEDDAITNEVSKIRDNIKNYVQAYYHQDILQTGAAQGAILAEVAEATRLGTRLTGLLENPYTRGEAIRLVISHVALSRCEEGRTPSLLPWDLASLACTVPKNDGNNTGPSALFSKWKTITGTLLQSQYGRQGPSSGAPSQGVLDAIAAVDSALAPFVKGSIDGGKRHKNLEMIFRRAESLAFLLFSQPNSFRFDFNEQKGLVVFPGLLEVVNEQGQVRTRKLWKRELAEGVEV